MTYDASESGAATGQPVELYEFRHGPNFYRYTSADTDQVYNAKTYTAATLSRNAIEATQEIARGALNISTVRSLPIVELFNPLPPSDVVTLTLYRRHRGDADTAVIWMGRILNVGWRGLQAEIRCESVYSSIKRPGLRRMYQKQCPHVLYSAQCGVSAGSRKVTRQVTGIGGLNVTLADMGAYPTGTFDGGYIEWQTAGGTTERRSIRAQVGAVATVNFQPLGLAVGASVDIYPGCDHTLATCHGKFANSLNYGGMPYIPQKNPFDGTPVY